MFPGDCGKTTCLTSIPSEIRFFYHASNYSFDFVIVTKRIILMKQIILISNKLICKLKWKTIIGKIGIGAMRCALLHQMKGTFSRCFFFRQIWVVSVRILRSFPSTSWSFSLIVSFYQNANPRISQTAALSESHKRKCSMNNLAYTFMILLGLHMDTSTNILP